MRPLPIFSNFSCYSRSFIFEWNAVFIECTFILTIFFYLYINWTKTLFLNIWSYYFVKLLNASLKRVFFTFSLISEKSLKIEMQWNKNIKTCLSTSVKTISENSTNFKRNVCILYMNKRKWSKDECIWWTLHFKFTLKTFCVFFYRRLSWA